MDREMVVLLLLMCVILCCAVCFGMDFTGMADTSASSAGSSWDSGGWQQSGAAMERITETSSQTEQTGSSWEIGEPVSVTEQPFTEPAVEGGTWSGKTITECYPVTEWGTFLTTEAFNVETLQSYSSLNIDTSTGSKPMIDVTAALPAAPFNFAEYAANKIPVGDRPQVVGLDGNARNAFAFEAKPFDFASAMERAVSADPPVQLGGTAGGPVFKTDALNLITAGATKTSTEERNVDEFTRCETDKVYEQYTEPTPPPPPPPPVANRGGGDSDSSSGKYFYKAPDGSKGIGGSGGADTVEEALRQLPRDNLGNYLGTVTPR